VKVATEQPRHFDQPDTGKFKNNTGGFNCRVLAAKEHSAAKPQLNSHREGREVLNKSIGSVLLRALRVLCGGKVFSKMSDLDLLHRKEHRERNLNCLFSL
jgi:hypothetical protein